MLNSESWWEMREAALEKKTKEYLSMILCQLKLQRETLGITLDDINPQPLSRLINPQTQGHFLFYVI